MARPDVTKYFLRGSALGCPLADALQPAGNLNALFNRLQALQKSLCQMRTLSLG